MIKERPETWTKGRLVAFTERVKEAFLTGNILAPVHLSDPAQAEPLIEIFKDVRPQDWLFSTYRNHYHCLLKGVPEEELFQAVLDGRSMYYMSAKHKIVTSAIVGGCLPMAVGVAWAAKRKGSDERVWCFLGDMAAEAGVFAETVKYAYGHELPVTFVVEDNGLSTNTPTRIVWGPKSEAWTLYTRWRYVPHLFYGHTVSGVFRSMDDTLGCSTHIWRYRYERSVPHVGVGKWVVFP